MTPLDRSTTMKKRVSTEERKHIWERWGREALSLGTESTKPQQMEDRAVYRAVQALGLTMMYLHTYVKENFCFD